MPASFAAFVGTMGRSASCDPCILIAGLRPSPCGIFFAGFRYHGERRPDLGGEYFEVHYPLEERGPHLRRLTWTENGPTAAVDGGGILAHTQTGGCEPR